MTAVRGLAACAVVALAALGACTEGGDLLTASPAAGTGARQTGLPGHVTAGGRTSGTVMATTASAPARDMGAVSREGGTPGIPQGAGGNTSGTQMGGSTGTSALANTGEQTSTQRTPGQGAPAHAQDRAGSAPPAAAGAAVAASAPSAPSAAAHAATAAAAAQQQQLDDRMSHVARRWQQLAASHGWPVNAPPVATPAAAPSTAAPRARP